MFDFKDYLKKFPNEEGYFGKYGGIFIGDELKEELLKIYNAYKEISKSEEFILELKRIRKEFQGRPTPLYKCKRICTDLKKEIYLKREDLNHTGAHKLNHCMGEVLLAKYLNKKKVIAETGAGQHGVALATAAAYFGLECEIHMGEVDIKKQATNVNRMKVLGAKVVPATHGLKTLKEAVDSAFNAYVKDFKNTMYCIGSAVGPHPFPLMVRDFQSVVGFEAREQILDEIGKLPDAVVACIGGGSNAMGIFSGFIEDSNVKLVAVEPLGKGKKLGDHAASLTYGDEGVMHGFNSIMLKDENGDPAKVYSIASGLDYPSSGPEHAFLKEIGRVNYETALDSEAIDAFFALSKKEGIIPALESSHAIAHAIKMIENDDSVNTIIVNLSGRGDKDLSYVLENYKL